MNNSKWKKLFLIIFSNLVIIKYCEIVDFFSSAVITLKINLNGIEIENYIYQDCLDNFLFKTGEYAISYREIEYLEFKKHWHEKEIGKMGFKTMEQNTNKIKEILSKIGQFEWEETEEYLRVIGYR